MDDVWNALWSLFPTVCLGLLFWFVMRAIIHSDRSERRVLAEIEKEERLKRGLSVTSSSDLS